MNNPTNDPKTIRQFALEAIEATPGISSIQLRKLYAEASGKNPDKMSTILTQLAQSSAVQRERVNSPHCGHYFLYWLRSGFIKLSPTLRNAAEPAPAPVRKPDGFKVAILTCQLQAELSADTVYAKACLDCVDAILAKMGGAA